MENCLVNLPVFDRAGLLDTLGGDRTLLEGLVRSFLEELPGETAVLHRSVGQGDLERAGRLAHKLKGTSRNIRALLMGEVFARMEVALRSGDTAGALVLFDRLEQAFAEFTRVCSEEVEP